MTEWKCIWVENSDLVGQTIEKWEKAGWSLHTYSPTLSFKGGGMVFNPTVASIVHYLLFFRKTIKQEETERVLNSDR